MNSDDSDDDLLVNLLTADDSTQKPEDKGPTEAPIKEFKVNPLKELDIFNSICTDFDDKTSKDTSFKDEKKSISLLEENDNSDEEDKKYFEKQSYSEYGREIKHLLKNKESESSNNSSFGEVSRFYGSANNINKTSTSNNISSKINSSPLSNKFNSSLGNSSLTSTERIDKNCLQVQSSTSTCSSVKKDVYSDPIFGLRMVKPLISSSELVERMQGRKAVTVSNVKLHLANKTAGNSSEDWVIAGVLLNKSTTKTSQKGNQYCIWKLTDLALDMKTVSVFLFSSAYKSFWKISSGTVVAILNPSVLESKDDRDLATLSVDSGQKIMVMGYSKDLGKCKSMKKNGEPCTAPVNLNKCEYCVYHVKQEYAKYSKRSELQLGSGHRFSGSNNIKKPNIIQRHPDALPFVAIPAKRNEALYKKDCERLALLRGEVRPPENTSPKTIDSRPKKISLETSSYQSKKDIERLNKLREWDAKNNKNDVSSTNQENKVNFKLNLTAPKLGAGVRGGIIDLSEPITKTYVNRTKMNAIEWAKKNGGIKKQNPNQVRPSKEVLNENGRKRRREEEGKESTEEIIEKDAKKSKFQEMLEMKSAHSDLIERREEEEQDKYFRKLEVKEQMEEKMMTTYKIECKAVRCGLCKYIAFSGSDLCKKLQHPLTVIDAIKRFFKCGDCGNRTVCLDRMPSETCKKCSGSKWVKTAMMNEKRTEIPNSKLCIRGGEEKFIGSVATDASLNLLVPESD